VESFLQHFRRPKVVLRGYLVLALSGLLAMGLASCTESAQDSLGEARAALADARYDEALAAAEVGLANPADEVITWGLELVKLEALARGGQGEPALAQLQKLAAERPENVPADQYAAIADQLRGAGAGPEAIVVLDSGLKRFPEDAELLRQIEAAKAAPAAGSEELEMLKTLGYVE
jgi:tetratricopeptide (TPR) repeat protein